MNALHTSYIQNDEKDGKVQIVTNLKKNIF